MNSFIRTYGVWTAISVVSVLLIAGTAAGFTGFSWLEVAAFVTGLACVWLVVIDSHWNWPIGNINAGCFLALFIVNRLYANAVLQIVFIILGFWGWYMWLRKRDDARLHVRNGDRLSLYASAAFVVAFLYPVQQLLISVDGAAPFWDTFTTMLSLAATYLMGRKYVENWYCWITADVIYIALFYDRGLYLTSVLYVCFLAMAISGLMAWRKLSPRTEPSLTVQGGTPDA